MFITNSVMTNNLNQEIVIKNLVTFKRWDGVKDLVLVYVKIFLLVCSVFIIQ